MYTLAEIYKKIYAEHLIEAKRLSGKVCFDLLPDEMPFTDAVPLIKDECYKRGYSPVTIDRTLNVFWRESKKEN